MNIVWRIVVGLIVGILLATVLPVKVEVISMIGTLFISALKSAAPILVFFVVMSAIAQHEVGKKTNMKTVILLYLIGTVSAGIIGVIASFIFKLNITFPNTNQMTNVADMTPPDGIGQVFENIANNIVCNPIDALLNANYLGILTWAIILGIALRHMSDNTKSVVSDISDTITKVLEWVINLAPLGVMGIVYAAISDTGISALASYGKIVLLLVGCMLTYVLIVCPIIEFVFLRRNPYPLVFKCLSKSGITAFFTRSSAANIPVNMKLCQELGLDKDTYTISIPLGSTINMGGGAITISVLSLTTAFTLGIDIDVPTAILLCIISAVSACGASGIPGGSLLLIPLACSLFGVPSGIAMSTVGVGYIISVVQDSCETAVNSSTDVLFTAIADYSNKRKIKIQKKRRAQRVVRAMKKGAENEVNNDK